MITKLQAVGEVRGLVGGGGGGIAFQWFEWMAFSHDYLDGGAVILFASLAGLQIVAAL